jgi:FlaA1/EpsC-like NDP-sugar epimerase
MTRYFMTIPEASWLILDAAALGTNGDLFVLDMGDPIRIVDLARDLVRLAGRDPDTQPMDIVGLRPGEKLHEELFYESEQVDSTPVAKVMRAVAQPPPACVREDARELLAMAGGGQEDDLRAALLAYALGEGNPQLVDLDEVLGAASIEIEEHPQPVSIGG